MEACSSQGKFNVTTYNAVAMAIITLQTFAGMWINAFIVSVLCVSWVKKRSFNTNEKILLLLGCSRVGYLCTAWVGSFIENIYSFCVYVHQKIQIISALLSFFNIFSLWISAILSVFYCIKIANFQHTFFIYLKVRIDRIVPWLMLTSVPVSLGVSVFVYIVIDEARCDNNNCTTSGYLWHLTVRPELHFFPLYFFTGFVYATAFAAVISSALLLLFSLWRHKHRMQTKSGKNVSVDAHIKAMKSILSFFFIYTFNFIILTLSLIYSLKKEKAVMFFITFFLYSFSAAHSLILIFSNPKLEKTLLRTLSCLKCKICMRHET
ncbi:taste receptor type 2 member 8 [Calypte anna]|uniref:taste receptor type 2 member 8 n=1 Tax=Calypte anna TaxID=9244 RepID=UPI0011C3570A|nr:taste receptor type 2 member 8 [Calypte anna]